VRAYIVSVVLLLAAFPFLSIYPWNTNSELHTTMEAIATCLALVVGAMAIVRFYSRKSNRFLFVGTGFIGTALLDGYHAVVTSSYFCEQFPSAMESLSPWSWIASRLFLSICLYLSWLAWWREERLGERGRIGETAIYIGAGVLTTACFLIFAFVPLPRAYFPELFFHRPVEFVPAIFLFIALVGYLKKERWRIDEFESWLIMALLTSFVGQAVYMSRSSMLCDAMFNAAHLLKIGSYGLVLIGLLGSMYSTFRQVAQQTDELELVNKKMHREIHERKAAETQLAARADELARSNAELEQFAYVASHDLQEPLRKVASCCQALAEDYADKLDDDARQWIDYAVGGAKRMQRLISDLLTYSRVATKGRPLQATDAESACRAALENLQFAIEDSSAQITCHPLPRVLADETQLVQLLQNLIGNAIKFRGANVPQIEIGYTNITDPAQTDLVDGKKSADVGNLCQFYISDDGIGISPKYFEQIFAIFQRLHRKDEYPGTGIGLALCKKIVERHGGQIWVESSPGKGSTFYFTLTKAGANGFVATDQPGSISQPTIARC
jgi:signal transduction histidine kinase